MLYLNGEIRAVYLGGHYHSEAYLGNVLVWDGIKEKPGVLTAQVVFENSAQGVSVVALTADVVAELNAHTTAIATPNVALDVAPAENINVSCVPQCTENDAVDAEVSHGIQTRTGAKAEDVAAEDSKSTTGIQLAESAAGADVAGENSRATIDMIMRTPKVSGADITAENSKLDSILMELVAPIVSAWDVILEKEKTTAEVSIKKSAAGADVAGANGSSGTDAVLTPTAAGGDGISAEGAAAAQVIESSAVTAEDGVVVECAGETSVIAFPTVIPDSGVGAPAEGNAEIDAVAVGIGSTITPEGASALEALNLETQILATVLAGVDVTEFLQLKTYVNGTAYIPWEYPVQEEDGTLRITQVYSALQESDGTLALDAPVSGKVIRELEGIAWIIPDGTVNYYKTGATGDGWAVYADRNEVQYIVLENRNEQAVDVRMNGSTSIYVTAEAVAADAHPRGHITVNGVTVATADGVNVPEQGIYVQLRGDWGNFKNWQPNTQKVIGVHGGTYHGEYASTPMYPERATLAILSIHTTEGS